MMVYGVRTPVDALATFIVEPNGRLVWQNTYCPTTPDAVPVPTAEDVRQVVVRLLPKVGIGSAWSQRALVNAESIVWAETAEDRRLAQVTVVGQPVELRISFARADWNFGDGTTLTSTSPGKAYDAAGDPCASAQCADYFGHTYRSTGSMTMTLRVAWTGEFSLDGGATWNPVDAAALEGPAVTRTLAVRQSRGVLVPNP